MDGVIAWVGLPTSSRPAEASLGRPRPDAVRGAGRRPTVRLAGWRTRCRLLPAGLQDWEIPDENEHPSWKSSGTAGLGRGGQRGTQAGGVPGGELDVRGHGVRPRVLALPRPPAVGAGISLRRNPGRLGSLPGFHCLFPWVGNGMDRSSGGADFPGRSACRGALAGRISLRVPTTDGPPGASAMDCAQEKSCDRFPSRES